MDKNEKLQILADLVGFDTVDKDESMVADYLAKLLEKHGIQSQKIESAPNRENLIASLGTGTDKVLGITGHMDVVSIGDESKWTNPPFKMTSKDGKLYGRGTTDMKSGLAALIIAMIELKTENAPLNGTLKLLATVDEEKNEMGAKTLVQKGFADDLTALLVAEPSGVDKAKLTKSGNELPIPKEQLQALLNANKTNEQHFLVFAHNGSFDYKVTSIGKIAHSSMPQLGINAIDHLLEYYNEQKKYFENATIEDDILGKIVPVTTLINGGEQINSVPGKAYLIGRVRTTPAITGDRVTKDLNKIIEKLNTEKQMNLKLEVLNNQSPVKSNPQSEFITLVQKLGAEHLEQIYPLMHVAGGTDAAQFVLANKDLQVAVIGPGNDTSHMIDEYVDEDMYLRHIDFFKNIITEYLK